MFGQSRAEYKAELDQIRAKAVADSRTVDELTRSGFTWVGGYPGQIIGRDLTCDACGAVVTIKTQAQHAAWHAEVGTSWI
jgi:hypothetical protein